MCVLEETYTLTQPDLFELKNTSLSKHNNFNINYFDNNDGSISVELVGGTAPYSYSWTSTDHPSFSGNTANLINLKAGKYQLEAKDQNNCTVVWKQL